MDQSTEAIKKMLLSSKMTFLPRLNAFWSYELAMTRFLGLKDMYVGAQLSWNVFDGYKSIGKMERSEGISKSRDETQQYKAKSQLEKSS
jgi:outer membrane protein TolC